MNHQASEILNKLKKGPLTKVQILNELGILNGGGRIHDLRQENYNIKTDLIEVRNRRGTLSRIAQYRLGRPHKLKRKAA